jgi:hypothetical protein
MVSYIFNGLCAVVALSLALGAYAGGGAPSNTEHQVGLGDSIESIARKYAGHEKYADVIRELNPHLNEVGLQIGDYLFVPDQPLGGKQNLEPQREGMLPPNPLKRGGEIKVIPGIKYGLAHVYRPGGFKVVLAPVNKE